MRDCRLERIKAIVERQQCMTTEGDNHSLFFKGKNRLLISAEN